MELPTAITNLQLSVFSLSSMPHIPVLMTEILSLLNPRPGAFVIDGTADGGGYTRAILARLGTVGTFLALDWDAEMVRRLRTELKIYERSGLRIVVAEGNFAELPQMLRREGLPRADALVLDLGFSSNQLEDSGRGFSFSRDEPLLMTYSDESEPVREILKRLSAEELSEIIKNLGGERYARRIATAITKRNRERAIETSGELARVVVSATPKHYERGRIHPATRTFLALRIYANKELENLARILEALPTVLRPGGKAAIVSFHSTEDRIVKQAFRKQEAAGQLKVITKKPLTPQEQEITDNPRARSAKLRVAVVL
jgi:16S rRNA (cytosine1402-N4)-methyltransferase